MTKDSKEVKKELCHISIDCAENGYTISASYEPEPTLSQKKKWIPPASKITEDFVEKTSDAVVKRVKEIL